MTAPDSLLNQIGRFNLEYLPKASLYFALTVPESAATKKVGFRSRKSSRVAMCETITLRIFSK